MAVISVIPIQSEKAYRLSAENTYMFKVPLGVNKQQIKHAVEEQYGVSVLKVKSLVQQGSMIAFSKGKRARPGLTKRNDIKKAFVTLAEGDSIKAFDEKTDQEEAK
jgi:large subunit ribosomal protein L23